MSVPFLGTILTTLFLVSLLAPFNKSHLHSKTKEQAFSLLPAQVILLSWLSWGIATHILDRHPFPDMTSAGHRGTKDIQVSKTSICCVGTTRDRLLVVSIQNLGPIDGGYAGKKAGT